MSETIRKVYISGPITGLAEAEFKENFARGAEKVRQFGLEPVNPVDVVPECDNLCGSDKTFEDGTYQHTWQCYMKADIKLLLDCDAIYMLPGWSGSRGAAIELKLARALDYLVFTLDKEGKLVH